tara:strand:+ start:376 stop:579 length:204 start_codon:yes stop_codon:yes gene_type:complete
MITALNGQHTVSKEPTTEGTLIFYKSYGLKFLYKHQWSTGWQGLVFESHENAKKWAKENNCRHSLDF